MFYYKKNIGDYYKKTGRLSMLEHGAYTLLIDACYDRERFPTLEDALDWTWSRTDEEIAAVKFVLSKFFTLEGDLYVQKRIKDELDAYHALSETNSRIAKQREEKRRQRKRNDHEACTNGEPIVNEAPPNQEPLTKNQEPRTINQEPIINMGDSDKPKRFDFKKALSEVGGNDDLVTAFMAIRKTKKATNSEPAFKLFMSNVEKSGMGLNQILEICIQRDWKGFDPSWLKNQNSNYQTSAQQTAKEHDKWRMAEQRAFGQKDVTPVDRVLIGDFKDV